MARRPPIAKDQGPSTEELYGTWRLLSVTGREEATGKTTDLIGKSPRGFLSYGRDGRMFAILTGSGRPKPTELKKVTDGQRAELFNTMVAYAGTFTVSGSTVTHHVDISWNENWTGTDQVRHVRIEGGKLHITSNPQPSGTDGRIVVAKLVWERVRSGGRRSRLGGLIRRPVAG